MPEQQTLQRARGDAEQGKSPSTQAGKFVREQIHRIREGKHGPRSTKEAIAIGLAEARRAGVPLAAPKGEGEVTKKARRDLKAGGPRQRPSAKRSHATVKAPEKRRPCCRFSFGAFPARETGATETRTESMLRPQDVPRHGGEAGGEDERASGRDHVQHVKAEIRRDT